MHNDEPILNNGINDIINNINYINNVDDVQKIIIDNLNRNANILIRNNNINNTILPLLKLMFNIILVSIIFIVFIIFCLSFNEELSEDSWWRMLFLFL
jgi:hypothetical protein